MDMLDRFGVMPGLVEQGLVRPKRQIRDREEGVIATFDPGLPADLAACPFRLQCEQWELTEKLRDLLAEHPDAEPVYDARATDVAQTGDGATLSVERPDGAIQTYGGKYLIAAGGAHSMVRKRLGIAFDSMTIPEIFLSMSTTLDVAAALEDLSPIAYPTDPTEWAALPRTPSLWRAPLPTDPTMTEAEIKDPGPMETRHQALCAEDGPCDVVHATACRVRRRVAETSAKGRVFPAGDSAHLNNPLGGMGMNGDVHDAVNLTEKLARV